MQNLFLARYYFLLDFFKHGFLNSIRNLFDEVENRRNRWDFEKLPTNPIHSLSNNDSYLNIVERALVDEKIFEKFRSNMSYRQILEHVSVSMGFAYLELIHPQKAAWETLISLSKFSRLGTPARYNYPTIGKISPTALRYAKVHQDILDIFGDIGNFRIAEIGVGYGGQASHFLQSSPSITYSLYDLPLVEELAYKYLGSISLGFLTQVTLENSDGIVPKEFDLVISNYAFSELDRQTQDEYLANIIMRSKRGYITWNSINPDAFNSYSLNELIDLIPGSKVMDETPLTAPDNAILFWGD